MISPDLRGLHQLLRDQMRDTTSENRLARHLIFEDASELFKWCQANPGALRAAPP